MQTLADQAHSEGLVVLAGAGISMPPPTCLPSWNEFNTAVLKALTEHVGAKTDNVFADQVILELIAQRDAGTSFSPDFQAQIIGEEVGTDYFQVLRVLDTDERNACHDAIAALAHGGFIRAVVTTNFDRLIERGLNAAGVAHRVFFRASHFGELSDYLDAGKGAPLPVIKVHGSVESPESGVDTLQQRLIGRPEELEAALGVLLARYHWLVVGFSGADLDYDRDYLGLRPAAPSAKGMTYLVRQGSQPRPAMCDLLAAFGTAGKTLTGNLPEALLAIQAQVGLPTVAVHSAEDTHAQRLAIVEAGARAWVDRLGDMSAINVFSALLDATGHEEETLAFLRRAWRWYRWHMPDEELTRPSYWRFNYNLGHRLLERGDLGQNVGPIAEWFERAARGEANPRDLDNGFQFLARAANVGHLPEAYVDLALVRALLKGPKAGWDEVSSLLNDLAKPYFWSPFADGIAIGGAILEMMGSWTTALNLLEKAYGFVERYGDEPRRARLCTQIARVLIHERQLNEAEVRLREAYKVADRLALAVVRADADAARGMLEVERGHNGEGLGYLLAAYDFFRITGRRPRMVDILPTIAWAAYLANEQDLLKQALASLQEMAPEFPGYEPFYHILMCNLYYFSEQYDEGRKQVGLLRETAKATENEWALLVADRFDGLLRQA